MGIGGRITTTSVRETLGPSHRHWMGVNCGNYSWYVMMTAGNGSCIDFRNRRERRLARGRCGRRRFSDWRCGPRTNPARHRCFAVFSLLIILLDLVRRRVVHCTRLRTPRPATRCLSPHHTCYLLCQTLTAPTFNTNQLATLFKLCLWWQPTVGNNYVFKFVVKSIRSKYCLRVN